MRFSRRFRVFIAALVIAAAGSTCPSRANASDQAVQSLIDKGEYKEAEKLLSAEIKDAAAPITSAPAVQLEVLRRTRQDFSLTEADVLRQLRRSIPDVKPEDLASWRETGDLQFRMIDGEVRYFRSAVSNLFRFSADARERRKPGSFRPEKKTFDMTAHVRELVREAEHSSSAEVFPVRHRISYSLAVNPNHPRVKPGAVVRCWLPYPQEYRQQRNVKLLASSPTEGRIADKEAPQRTIYFEQTIGAAAEPPKFSVEFQYDTAAYCPKLDPKLVQPYDTNSAVYRENTAERAPHIVFTPEVKRIAREVVGAETNPLEKARRIFRWVSKNLPWCSEMEYGIIPNISAKGLKARRGDCGVAGMTFITLCRAAGVPARWQSGWQERPGDWNMHDWSEIYVLPWGWLPADASYGVRDDPDPRVRDFFCGHIDPYRLIVNLDYGRSLQPPKTSFRSEPNDFQRGEIEIDGHNLYFNEWDWKFAVETTPLNGPAAAAEVSSAGGGN
jgi:hypothetical protein